jgi:hypothetical protein
MTTQIVLFFGIDKPLSQIRCTVFFRITLKIHFSWNTRPSFSNFLFIYGTDIDVNFHKTRNLQHRLYFFSVDASKWQVPLSNQMYFGTYTSITGEGTWFWQNYFGHLHGNTV